MTLMLTLLLSSTASAGTDYDVRADWEADWGGDTVTVGFADLGDGVTVTDQYAGDGLTFTDGDDVTVDYSFSTDGTVLGGNGDITIALDAPASAIGIDYPGALLIELYDDTGLVYSSVDFGGTGSGFFGGVLDETFTTVVLSDWVDGMVFVDNVSIGFATETDSDGDGVLDGDDVCDDTVVPEAGVPSQDLGSNRFALVDDDDVFDTVAPNGNGPGRAYTLADTAGCSCEQIIEETGLGNGHEKFGCSIGAMDNWVDQVEAAREATSGSGDTVSADGDDGGGSAGCSAVAAPISAAGLLTVFGLVGLRRRA